MKIIAGDRKGFKLEGPMDKSIRPTSDLRRDAIFNTLGELIEGETFYDIFSGTGAMGLEALSRGASQALLVEMSKKAQELIKRNIEKVRYQKQAKLFPTNAYRFIESHRPRDPGIYFLDPPFPEYINHPERFTKYLTMLMERVAEGSIIIIESRWKMNPEVIPDPENWYMRRYGETRVAYWGIVDTEPDSGEDEDEDLCDEIETMELEEPDYGDGDSAEAANGSA